MTPRIADVKGHWFWGMGRAFVDDPLRALTECGALGDVVRMRFGPFRVMQLNHPEHIKRVFQNPRIYGKQTMTYGRLRILLGLGLVVSDGDFWLRQRRIAQPAFHKERVSSFADTMVRAGQAVVERLRALAGAPFDVAAEMTRATLAVVCETLLGGDMGEDAERISPAFAILNEIVTERMNALVPAPMFVPTRTNRRFKRALAELDGAVYRIIARRRESGAQQGDLLSMLMHARDADTGEAMNDRQLRDEVTTILLAGHETTAVTLTWAFYLLSQHPEIEARLRTELVGVLGSRAPGLADCERLTYTRQIIDESLRLYPPVWAMDRSVAADDELDGGVRVPKGVMVLMSPWVVQRAAAWWGDGDVFRPERFARGAEYPRYAYFPFIGGPRQCIGNVFALMESQLILAIVAQSFRLALVPGQNIELQPLLTLRPKHGMIMTATPVPASATPAAAQA
jgi:cytochrome P450